MNFPISLSQTWGTAVRLMWKVLFLIFLPPLALLALSPTTPWTIRCPHHQPPTLPCHVLHAVGKGWRTLTWLHLLKTPKQLAPPRSCVFTQALLHSTNLLPKPCHLQDSAQIPPDPEKNVLLNQPTVISYLVTIDNRLSVSHTPPISPGLILKIFHNFKFCTPSIL